MNWYETIIVTAAVAILKQFVKNPSTVASIKGYIQEINTDSGLILAALNTPPAS